MLKTICGTPTYVAPEITRGDKYDGVAVDLWSCGCVLLFMLAAAPAFSGVDPCSDLHATERKTANVLCTRQNVTRIKHTSNVPV
jgi:serine/threonine protein kinase